jgi:hypothetical protein
LSRLVSVSLVTAVPLLKRATSLQVDPCQRTHTEACFRTLTRGLQEGSWGLWKSSANYVESAAPAKFRGQKSE